MAEPLDEGSVRPTTVEDLNKVFDCWTRMDILAGLAGPELSVHALAERLGLKDNLLSTHLGALRFEGLARCEVRGQRRYWSLTDSARVVATAQGLCYTIRSDDTGWVSIFIPVGARVMRILRAGYRLALAGRRGEAELKPVPPPAPRPARSPRTPRKRRPASGPG